MFEQVACITFDLDDTLWAMRPTITRAERRFYDWLHEHYAHITAGMSAADLLQHRIAFARANPQLGHDLTRLRKAWLAALAAETGTQSFRIDEGFAVYWEARNEVELFDHVESTLETLSSRYTVGAITNGNASVERIGIGHLFDFVVTSAQTGAGKPDARIFEAAAARAGVGLERVLHVGDDAVRDVAGALDAGALAAWVTDRPELWQHPRAPHLVIAHVRELLDHLPARAAAGSSGSR